MKLTARLAFSQIKVNFKRAIWTISGIALSTAMITAICGFTASAAAMIRVTVGDDRYNRAVFSVTMLGMVGILCLIVVLVSVVVISNAFRVSAGERTRQFGILKSVGATKRQIAAIVMYEGLWLSIIGIPAGIIIGTFVEFVGTSIANNLLAGINNFSNIVINFEFIFAWQAVIISAVIALATVLLSAWLPARKASKIPAISAIRNSGDVKITTKRIKTNRLISLLFGFEGMLAAKSIKRNKRNLRATVVSLTISIVLFIAVSGFHTQISQMSNMIFATIEATVAAQFVSPVAVTYAGEEGKINEVNYTAIDGMTQRKVTERLNEYDDSPIFAIGSLKYIYAASVPAEMITKDLRRVLTPDASQTSETDDTNVGFSVTLLAIDDDRYAELCKSAGVPLGSNLLVNLQRAVIDGKTAEFEPFNFKNQTLELKNYDGTVKNLTLDGELTAGEIPNDVLFELTGDLTVILPETETQSFTWFSDTGNAEGFTEYANTVLAEEIKPDGITDDMIDVLDIRAATEAVRSTYQLIMVFIYGFVGMLTLIGLTNVISTISTNVRSRSREFAVLKSVGMTQKGLKTVLNYESILSSIKSLMYGLPLGIAAAYLIYRFAIYSEVQYRYVFPWLTVLEIVLGVFVITWVTMRYSISRLKEKNIVETIRE